MAMRMLPIGSTRVTPAYWQEPYQAVVASRGT